MDCADKRASGKSNTLADLVAEFLEQDGCCPRDEIKAFQHLRIEDAIKRAAQAKDGNGILYSHQRWLRQDTADKAESILLKSVVAILACKNFDSLHDLLKSKLSINGASEMYWYDTAFRIGISMSMYPEKVYLHRGTRDGAKALGIYNGKDILEMSELPMELQGMKPHQVEDFLCIEKDVLHRFKPPQNGSSNFRKT